MSKYREAADKALIDHMRYCRALLNVPEDDTLAVAIRELVIREAKLRTELDSLTTTSKSIIKGLEDDLRTARHECNMARRELEAR